MFSETLSFLLIFQLINIPAACDGLLTQSTALICEVCSLLCQRTLT